METLITTGTQSLVGTYPWGIIDLTKTPKDHFTALPSELIHMICAYLFPTHHTTGEQLWPCHPLRALSRTSKRLRSETQAWCLHFLKEHKDITKYIDYKSLKRQQQRDFMSGRGGLLHWADKHCVFCGNKSKRPAILMNGLRCCAACDKAQWPDKITKTAAKAEYDLKDNQLTMTPFLAHNLPKGMPKIRSGSYMVSGVLTTMFCRREIRKLACFVHGDLDEHMRQKAIAKENWKARRTVRMQELTKMQAIVAYELA